ncbi:MAG: YceI family protein [Cyclobacteriaceae bacterium]
MKKEKTLFTILFSIIVFSLIAQQAPPPNEVFNDINIENSFIKWKGSNLFKINEHYGTVKFQSGLVHFKGDSEVSGGEFLIDMKSIVNTDGKYNEMLVWHLKNEDFFEVETFPTASLKIIAIEYSDRNNMTVNAELTIKGKTQPIEFKSVVEQVKDQFTIRSRFIIDRSKWGITFGSKDFIQDLSDDIISDAIEFEVEIAVKHDGC